MKYLFLLFTLALCISSCSKNGTEVSDQEKSVDTKMALNELISHGNFNFISENEVEFEISGAVWEDYQENLLDKDSELLFEKINLELQDYISTNNINNKVETRNGYWATVSFQTPCFTKSYIAESKPNIKTRLCDQGGLFRVWATVSVECNDRSHSSEYLDLWPGEETGVLIGKAINCTPYTQIFDR